MCITGAIAMVGLAQNCSSWQPHGETPGLPRNLQACYASLFCFTLLYFYIHLWKKESAGVKINSLVENLFCYTIPDTSALHQY